MAASLQISTIRLRVPTLARSIEFYTQQLGFVLSRKSGADAELATSPDAAPILILTEQPTVVTPPRDSTGLFHAAVLLPTRPALGAWLQFAADRKVDFDGFADHGVSEAIYLSDPDENGLEFYADHPRAAWPFADGELAMTTRALAVRDLLAQAAPPNGAPLAGATWGHLHLRVADLEKSEAYYRATLGLEVMQRSFPGARFLAADGYHHHLGLNIWGNPRQPPPPDSLGLASATFARAGLAAPQQIATPEGYTLALEPMR